MREHVNDITGRGGSGMGRGGSSSGSFKKSRVEEESSDEEPQYRRESSRRKAKEQSKVRKALWRLQISFELVPNNC